MGLRAWLIKRLGATPNEDLEKSAQDFARELKSGKGPFGFSAELEPEPELAFDPERILRPRTEKQAAELAERERAEALRRWLNAAKDDPEGPHLKNTAVYLIGSGERAAARILLHIDRDECRPLVTVLADIPMVTPEEFQPVSEALEREIEERRHLKMGGLFFAREALRRAYKDGADLLFQEMAEELGLKEPPLHFLRKLSVNEIVALLRDEMPQVIALVLLSLPPELAAEILRSLGNPDLLIRKIRETRRVPREYVTEIARSLERSAFRYWDPYGDETIGKLIQALGFEPESSVRKMERLPAAERASRSDPESSRLNDGYRALVEDFTAAVEIKHTLQMMHETFCRLTSETLGSRLNCPVELECLPVQVKPYHEIVHAMQYPACAAVVHLDPLRGAASLVFPAKIAFELQDLMVGGRGDTPVPERELTNLELCLMEGLVVTILTMLRNAWVSVLDLRPRLSYLETNPDYMQIVPGGEPCFVVPINFSLPDARERVHLVIPAFVIEPINHRFKSEYFYRPIRRRDDELEFFLDGLPHRMDLALGPDLIVRAGDLKQLRIGSTIPLPGSGPEIQFRVEGECIARGHLESEHVISDVVLEKSPKPTLRDYDFD